MKSPKIFVLESLLKNQFLKNKKIVCTYELYQKFDQQKEISGVSEQLWQIEEQ